MQLLNVQGNGFLQPLTEVGDAFNSSNVIIVVHEESKRIFIWKGKDSGIRKKFISARAAQKIRFDDMAYTTLPIDEGENSKDETELIDLSKTSTVTLPKPKIKAPDTSNLKGIAAAKRRSKGQSSQKPLGTPTPPIAPLQQTTFQSVIPPEGSDESSQPQTIDARPVLSRANDTVSQDILKQVASLNLPAGFNREAVIIGKSMFTLIETRQSMFGKTIEAKELRKMDSPPDGVYFATDTTPRILINNSQVVFAEFLKRKPQDVPETVLADIDLLSKIIAKGMDASTPDLGKPMSKIIDKN